MPRATSRIAAIVFRRDEDPDPAVLAFVLIDAEPV